MTPVSAIPDRITDAAEWYLLSRLFERPRPGWWEDLAELAGELPNPLLRSLAAAAADTTEGEYLAVLGPGGFVSPREVGHQGYRDPGWVLADLARNYQAFGYTPGTEDPLDHVAVEAGFVAFLYLKEALAHGADDDEAVAVTRAAREAFMQDHLGTLAVALARQLGPDSAGYLAGAADLLAARMPDGVDTGETEVALDPLAEGCGACGTE
jgi:nitrate reductase assembly molybdenum cofactor insertion protein NarJ